MADDWWYNKKSTAGKNVNHHCKREHEKQSPFFQPEDPMVSASPKKANMGALNSVTPTRFTKPVTPTSGIKIKRKLVTIQLSMTLQVAQILLKNTLSKAEDQSKTTLCAWAQFCSKTWGDSLVWNQCCNLSGGVALIVWFTTNGMCAKWAQFNEE